MPTNSHDRYERTVLEKASDSFQKIGKAASDLISMYAALGIPLDPQCSLHQLINSAIEIAKDWEAGNTIGDDRVNDLIKGQTLLRILHATESLKGTELDHIKFFRSGCLDPEKRTPSKAKDTLWELELLAILRGHGIEAKLDEPDLIMRLPSGSMGISCKRVYSGKNAEKSMSNGVKQIKKSQLHGVLAVNIDDLVIPEEGILCAPNIQLAQNTLNEFNENFVRRNEKKLTDYVSTSRAAAVLVSTWAPLYLEDRGLSTCRQILIWSHPRSNEECRKMISEFEAHFMPA